MRFAVTTQLCLAADTVGTNYDVSFADAGGAFQAVAVVAFWIGRSADGAGRANLQRGYGWGTSSSNRGFVCAYATDGGGTAQNRCLAYTSGIIGTANEAAFDGSIDLTSLGNGTFRITVDDQLPADLLVGFMVFGDCTAFSAIKITPTGSGAQNYTVTGFEEDAEDQCLLTFGTMPTADPDTTLGDTGLMFGVAAGGPTPVNYVMWDGSNDNASTMQTIGRCRGDRCFNRSDTGITTVDTDGHVSAWSTNGFEVTWDTYSGTADRDFFVLPLKGARFKAGEFASSTSTGALTAQTGLGGTPNGLIVCSAGKAEDTTVSDHARTSFGVLDDDDNLFVQAEYDQDGVGDAAIYTALDADGSDGEIVKIVSVADGKYAGISAAFDSDGFTPTQEDADTGSSFNWYLLVGTESAGEPGDGAFSATGTLSGAGASEAASVGAVQGTGQFTGASEADSEAAGSFQSTGAFAGPAAAEQASTGALSGVATITGDAISEASGVGALASTATLVSTAEAEATAAGELEALAEFLATSASEARSVGQLAANGTIAAVGALEAGSVGAFDTQAILAGVSDAPADVPGDGALAATLSIAALSEAEARSLGLVSCEGDFDATGEAEYRATGSFSSTSSFSSVGASSAAAVAALAASLAIAATSASESATVGAMICTGSIVGASETIDSSAEGSLSASAAFGAVGLVGGVGVGQFGATCALTSPATTAHPPDRPRASLSSTDRYAPTCTLSATDRFAPKTKLNKENS